MQNLLNQLNKNSPKVHICTILIRKLTFCINFVLKFLLFIDIITEESPPLCDNGVDYQFPIVNYVNKMNFEQ